MKNIFLLIFGMVFFSTSANSQNCPTTFFGKTPNCFKITWPGTSAPTDPVTQIKNTVSGQILLYFAAETGINSYSRYYQDGNNCNTNGSYNQAKQGTFEFSFTSGNSTTCSYNSSGAILPIELSKFEVSIKNNSSILKWETSSEMNNSRFIIERQKFGRIDNFFTIGEIKGAGNSNETKSYEFIDNSPHLGLNYYRLKQVDYDGSYTYSEIEVVNHTNLEDEISYRVINNTIELSSVTAGKVFISDITGKIIHQKSIVENEYLQINLENQLPGLYFISTQDRNKLTSSKFILH